MYKTLTGLVDSITFCFVLFCSDARGKIILPGCDVNSLPNVLHLSDICQNFLLPITERFLHATLNSRFFVGMCFILCFKGLQQEFLLKNEEKMK